MSQLKDLIAKDVLDAIIPDRIGSTSNQSFPPMYYATTVVLRERQPLAKIFRDAGQPAIADAIVDPNQDAEIFSRNL